MMNEEQVKAGLDDLKVKREAVKEQFHRLTGAIEVLEQMLAGQPQDQPKEP